MPSTILAIEKFTDLGLSIVQYREEFVNSFEATVRVVVNWADRFQVIADVLGGPRSNRTFQLPRQYNIAKLDNAADAPFVVCLGVSVEQFEGQTKEGSDGPSGPKVPDKAYIDFEFGTPPWRIFTIKSSQTPAEEEQEEPIDTGTDWILSEEFEVGGEFLTVSRDGLFWNDPSGENPEPLKEDESPGIFLALATWTPTLYFQAREDFIDNTQLQVFFNTVNKHPMYSPTFDITFPAETLLFQTPIIEKLNTPYGEYYNVTFVLQFRTTDRVLLESIGRTRRLRQVQFDQRDAFLVEPVPQGWNTFPRAGHVDFQPIWTDKTDPAEYYRPYRPMDWRAWLPQK